MTELYKKYRPKTLKRMVGNKSTVNTLTNMLDRGTLPHTILFHGPSGCGKTTLGRILRKELNCSKIDFKELNTSNFRGIDTIREISRTMNLAATGGDVRVWLMDEAHKMTTDAQNAALKILEDTPKHVYFILCTSEPNKLIAAVKNRCTPFPVELLSDELMVKLLLRILNKEDKSLDDDLLEDLTDNSEGSARKGLVILDRILNLPEKERKDSIKEGITEPEVMDLCRAIYKKDPWKKVAKIIKGIKSDPESVRYAILGYARTILLSGKSDERAAQIILTFEDNFYDSKEAGLAVACYEIINGIG